VRKANLIQTAIWDDAEFAAIGPDAQLLYLFLVTQPTVSTTGLLSLRRRYWAQRIFSGDQDRLESALHGLERGLFVWLDEDTEELVIRSWVKHNVQKSPNIEKGARDAIAGISSVPLRMRLVDAYPTVFDALPEALINPSETLPEPFPEKARERVIRGNREEVNSSSVDRTRARETVWAAYHDRHPQSVLSRERRRLLDRRLDDYSAETLVSAIAGNHLDPHCNGENPSGKQYHDFELILRDADHIERYADVAVNGPPARQPEGIVEWTLSKAAESDEPPSRRELGDGS
jgi:hypothetical protein